MVYVPDNFVALPGIPNYILCLSDVQAFSPTSTAHALNQTVWALLIEVHCTLFMWYCISLVD